MLEAHLEDVRPSDLAIAAAVAIVALVATTLALEVAHLRRRADAPIIDPGIGKPIKVKPVLDVPPGEAAGAQGEAALPPEWARPEPAPEPGLEPPPNAVAPVDAPKPPPRRRRPTSNDPKTPPPTDAPPPPEGEPTSGDAEPTSGGDTEGEGSAGGDPLGARAIAAYRERLIRWLSARFQVRGSGLPRDELEKHRVKVEIEVSDGGIVMDYTILSADHPAFEAAARATLEAVKGEPLPPPPEYYPGALQKRLRVTFVCTESTCD